MSIYTFDEAILRNLAAEIEAIPPRPHHSGLLEAANRLRSDCQFHYALNRGGWYRQGGVISPHGERVTDSLEAWAKTELHNCANGMEEFVEQYTDQGFVVTRHTGRTHYLVGTYSSAPADFLQLEVEELQEVLDRKLIHPENPPEDLQELIEPITPAELEAQAVGASYYQFRRLIDIRQIIQSMSISNRSSSGFKRMLIEWTHSSAATRGHFCDHWVIGLREHLDRYGNPVIFISLVSRHARELKPFHWNIELSGLEMSSQLHAFDRAAGYPSAWYFHLIAGTITPPKIAYAVARDLDAGFNYLPDTEAALIKNWVEEPYSA